MLKTFKSMLMCCVALAIAVAGEAATASRAYAQGGGGNAASVKGIVTDAMGPVVGATVIIKESSQGTTTGIDGAFTLPGVEQGDVIVVSYIGYKTVEIPYAGQTSIQVSLVEESATMDAVVVTALGIKRQEKALSYNVQQVKAEEITSVKDANFMNSLVGKVAGVEINSGANGAGGAARVVMRGTKSLTKNNNALYVIDGIPMFNRSFSGGEGEFGAQGGSEAAADINPEDIESISMLTGPSAAALYGSEAANGVVIINTKRGQKEKTTVTVSNNTTFSSAYIMPEMQSRYGTSTGISSWGTKINGNYDPRDFFNTGVNTITSASLSTGTQKNQTYASASTTNTTGIIPESEYERYNFTVRNTTSFAKDRLIFDFGGSFIIQKNRNMVSQGLYYNPLPALYLFPRGDNFDEIRLYERYNPQLTHMEQYWPYGDQGLSLQNPYWIQNRLQRETSKRRYMFNASLKWKITDWMDLSGRIRLDNSDYEITYKKFATTWTNMCDKNGGYEVEQQLDRSFYGDVMLNIDKTFCEDWTINAQIGASINDQRFSSRGIAGNLIVANHFALNNINYQLNMKPSQDSWNDQTQSIFASAELGWKSMLYLTLTGRNDWASQLAYSDQMSFFYPSVGLSAVVSNMFDAPKWLSFMKVRASYSKVGSAFSRYLSHPSAVYDTQSGVWSDPTTFPALHLKPEDTKSWEVGLNLRFLNKINLDITYYRSNTYNQTFSVDIPASSGYSKAIVQTGNIQNEGIELAVGYNNKWGDFMWSTNYTLTHNANKVIKLASGATNPVTGERIDMPEMLQSWLGQENVAPRVILREGGSMTDIYVNHEIARDLNGDIFVDQASGAMKIAETPMRKVGSLAPKVNMGWNNNFSWRGLNLGIVLTARIGGMAYSVTQGILDYYGASEATAAARDRGGIPINKGTVPAQTYYQTVSTAKGGHGLYYLYSATNVRLQELSLGYTLPERWFRNKLKMSVNLVGRNLWMIYCKAPFDPEMSAATGSTFYQNVDYFMQPSQRNIGFSVKLQF